MKTIIIGDIGPDYVIEKPNATFNLFFEKVGRVVIDVVPNNDESKEAWNNCGEKVSKWADSQYGYPLNRSFAEHVAFHVDRIISEEMRLGRNKVYY